MRRLAFAAVVSLALSLPVTAQLTLTGVGPAGGGAAPAGCAEATAFLGRTAGLDAAHTTAYTTLICGLVTDGVFAKLDALYMFATQDQATSLLNLVQNAYDNTIVNLPNLTFTADQGWIGGPLAYLDTNFNASTAVGAHYTQNAAHLGSWVLTNVSTIQTSVNTTSDLTEKIHPRYTDNNLYFRINGVQAGVPVATSVGFSLGSRTAANSTDGYKNGLNVSPADPAGSVALVNFNFTSVAVDYPGVIAATTIGGALTGPDVTAFCSRLDVYLEAIAGIAPTC